MSSLWKRASGPQFRMLKIVSGAVLNAAHAHPGRPVDKKFARGVSKRAVGTISAQWPELLAASPPSGAERLVGYRLRNGSQLRQARGDRRTVHADPRFSQVFQEISKLIGPAKRAGEAARAEAMIECLKIMMRVDADRPVRDEAGA